MSDQTDLKPIQLALDQATNIFIVITNHPNHDTVAAALSLFLALKENKKNVDIACPSEMVVEYSRLVGLDKIKNKAGNKNLVISFEYIKDSIEKVSYNVEGPKFNLVVQPKKGSKPLDPKSVSYFYSGMNADLIFIFGARSYQDINHLYIKNKKSFDSAHTISINKTLETPFAQTTISDKFSGSISEITFWLLEQIGLKPSADIASNLLSGIDRATNKFSSPNTPASSFLTAGKLIQLGAKRHITPQRPKIPNLPNLNPSPQESPYPPASSTPSPLLKPMTPQESEKIKPQEEDAPEENQPNNNSSSTPKDWLEPKIYRGSTKI
jgi:hypothetical protein